VNSTFNIHTLLFVLSLLILGSCKQETKSENKGKVTGDQDIDNISELIKANASDPGLLVDRANLFYKKELYDEAIADMQSAITIDSLQPDYYHFLSDIYMDYYKSKESIQTMERAKFLFPGRIPTLLKLSETQFILKQSEDALLTLQGILIADPQNAEAHFMRGMIHRSMGDIAQAKLDFQTSIEMDPELTDGWLILGSILEDEQNPQALLYYKTATSLDEDNPRAYHALAYYYQNNGMIDQALEIYRRINDIDKNYEEAYLNAGLLFLEKQEYEKANEQFNILCSLEPQSAIGYYYRGISFELLGEKDLAKQDYKNSLTINPDSEDAQKAFDNLNNS
jgi:tetratricopeptide (TPR) repeat protein